jgi:hypothetical protein
MKRKILASLFAITAIIGAGVFATGAYFTDTITQDNYTFTTSTADLKLGFCGGGVGTNCSAQPATIDNITFTSPTDDQVTGPGKSGVDCIVIQNTGQYSLTLTTRLFVTQATPAGMANAFEVAADKANDQCNGLVTLRDWASANAAQGLGAVPTGVTLAPGDRLYVLTYNRWNSSGDQSGLVNGVLKLKTVIEGRTV